MLPPPGRAALPLALRTILAQHGDALFSGYTLPVVPSRVVSAQKQKEGGDTAVPGESCFCLPLLPDAPPESFVGMYASIHICLHTHTSVCERVRERESVCVSEHEGIEEESECTYFHPTVYTSASASAVLARVLMM